MRPIRASEVQVGDTVIWNRREFVVVRILSSRSGRLEFVSESRGSVYFNPAEMVDVLQDPSRSWCTSCNAEFSYVNGECPGCIARERVEEEERAEHERAWGAANRSLSRTGEPAPVDSGVAAHLPSGTWELDHNNAAQMAYAFVGSEEVLSSHPARGRASLEHGDFAAAEYWFNEVADAALAALRVPEVFRDPETAKRLKKLRNPVTGESWGTVFGLGTTDHTLSEVYLDAAMAQSTLVLDNDEEFLRESDLDERVARHYRDTLFQWIDAGPVTDESLIRRYRQIRYLAVDPVSSMKIIDARELAILSGVSVVEYFSANQLGSKRISPLRWKQLQRIAFLNVSRRLHFLAVRQGRQALLLEMRIPGAGEYACSSPDPSPRAPIGWFPDPTWVHELRYFNGVQWTNDISNGSKLGKDSIDLTEMNDY